MGTLTRTPAETVKQVMRRPLRTLGYMRQASAALSNEDEAANLRVWQMYDEARQFRDHLIRFQNSLGIWEDGVIEFIDSLEPLMRAPLPRVWETVPGGLAEPIRTTVSHGYPHQAGGDYNMDILREAREDFGRRVDNDIMMPLDQWKEAIHLVEERLPDLQDLQLEVINRTLELERKRRKYERQGERRTAYHPKVEKAGRREALGHRGIRGFWERCTQADWDEEDEDEGIDWVEEDGEGQLRQRRPAMDRQVREQLRQEEQTLKWSRKQRKLEALRESYFGQEQLVWEQMTGLCRDAAWLKSYIVSSLLLAKESMQLAVVGVGETKQPLPSFGLMRSTVQEHGAVAPNIRLAAEFPPDLEKALERMQAARIAAEERAPAARGAALMPPLPQAMPAELHPIRATAQPMELKARPEVSPLEPVPPVPLAEQYMGTDRAPAGGRMVAAGAREGAVHGANALGQANAAGGGGGERDLSEVERAYIRDVGGRGGRDQQRGVERGEASKERRYGYGSAYEREPLEG